MINLTLVGLGLLVHFVFAIVKTVLIKYDFIEANGHPTAVFVRTSSSLYKLSIVFLLSVIIYPLMEELSFRLILNTNRIKTYFGIGFLTTFLFLIFSRIDQKAPINSEVAYNLYFIIISLIIAVIIKIAAEKFNIDVRKGISKYLPFFIFFSSVLFAIAHFNVVSHPHHLILYIPILFPYAVMGYILSYARLSMGFFYCVLCHSINNFFMFMMNLI